MKRLIFDVILVLVIFLLPWWVTLFLAIVGLFIFKNFYEFLIAVIVVFNISTTKIISIYDNNFIIYIFIFGFYALSQFVKSHIIIYKNK